MAPRAGLTLLEVMVALAIFLFAMVAIGRLVTFGTDRARDIQGRAVQLCQSQLDKLASGIMPLQDASGECDEDSDWEYKIECQQNGIQALWNVKVTVTRKQSDDKAGQAVLTQMVFDPSQRGSTLDPSRIASSSSDSGSSSSSDSSSSGAAGAGAAKKGTSMKPSTTPAPAPSASAPVAGAGMGKGVMGPAPSIGSGTAAGGKR
jgi:type II secretion system protein I